MARAIGGARRAVVGGAGEALVVAMAVAVAEGRLSPAILSGKQSESV